MARGVVGCEITRREKNASNNYRPPPRPERVVSPEEHYCHDVLHKRHNILLIVRWSACTRSNGSKKPHAHGVPSDPSARARADPKKSVSLFSSRSVSSVSFFFIRIRSFFFSLRSARVSSPAPRHGTVRRGRSRRSVFTSEKI